MTEMSAEPTRRAGDRPSPSGTATPLLRGVPLGEPLTGHAGMVWWGAWGRVDGRPVLASGGDDGTVRWWDPAGRRVALGKPSTGHAGMVLWGAWGQVDGRPVLATGGKDGTVRLWDAASQVALEGTTRYAQALLTGHAGTVSWGKWGLLNGRPVLATGGEDGTVRLWEVGPPLRGVPSGEPLTGHAGMVW